MSQLIDILNDRFGTNFTEADQLYFDSIKADAVADENIRQAASANTIENFSFVFMKAFEDLVINRRNKSEDMTAKILNEKGFKDAVSKHLMKEVYEEIRAE